MSNRKDLSARIVIGGAVSSTLTGAFKSVKDSVGSVGSALRRLETEQRTVTNAIQTFGRMGKNVDGLRERYAKLTGQIERLRSAHLALQRAEAAQQANAAKRAEYRGGIGETLAIGAIAAAPIKVAADRESHALGIAKQMQGSRDEAGNLTKQFWDMRKSVVSLGHEIPLATNDLLDMATAGLRMGIAKDEIVSFTKQNAKLASALELPADQVGDSMGKIRSLYKLTQDAANDLGGAINYLDDQNVAKGGEIIDFLQRAGGSASQVKATATQFAALGTTFLALGETAETAGTSTKAMFSKLALGAKGTKAARAAMAEMGINPVAMSKGLQTDAFGTLEKFMGKLNAMPAEKRTGLVVSIFGTEHVGQVSKLASNMDKLREATAQANSEMAKTSVEKEHLNNVSKTSSQLKLARNQVGDMADAIGRQLLPSVNQASTVAGKFATVVAGVAEAHPVATRAVIGTVVALTTLRVTTLAAGYGFTFLRGGVLQATGAVAKMQAGFALARTQIVATAASARVASLAMMATPIGAVVGALAVGGALVFKYWDRIAAAATGFGQGVREGLAPMGEMFRTVYQWLGPLKPVIDGIGTGIGAVWQWVTNLLQPVTSTKEQLAGATNAGKTFGRVFGQALTLVWAPLRGIVSAIQWIGQNAGSILNGVGSVVAKAKSVLPSWAGGEEETGTAATGAPALPAIPAPRGATGGNITNTITVDLKVENATGLDEEALARKLQDRIARGMATGRRSSMLDGALTQ